MAERLLPFLKEYWHILAALVVVVLALGETRWQVRELIRDRDAETNQWRRISAQGEEIVEHRGRIREIEKYITPESVQRWGEIQRIVEDDHSALSQHLRNHPD